MASVSGKILVSLMVMAFGSGCGGDGAMLGDAEVEIGTGTVAFEALSEGQDLELIAGPQGGFHFIVHARARGIVPGNAEEPGARGNPVTRFGAAVDGRAIELPLPPYELGYVEDGSEVALPSGRILQIDNDAAMTLDDVLVELSVEVEDADGDRASDGITVRAFGPVSTPEAFSRPPARGTKPE